MMKRHPWIFGGFLLLSGLLVPMAGFAEGEPVPYSRNYVLGPTFSTTSDANRDLLECNLLFQLVHHHSDGNSSSTGVVPTYRSGEDRERDQPYFDIFLFYSSAVSLTGTAQFLFPLYGRADDSASNIHRFAMPSLPPARDLSSFPTLSLFTRGAHSENNSHRLFPLYRSTSTTNGTGPLEAHTLDPLCPLYSYGCESDSDMRFNAIGLPPLSRSTAWSLYEYATSPTTVPDQLFPVCRDTHDERATQTTINVLGGEPVSLFRPRRRLSGNFQNPFPPYNYLADYPIGTNSLTEAVLIIGARVVLGILSHQLRAEQVSFPWLTF